MKKIILTITLMIPVLAFARIGGSKEECAARYGKHIRENQDGTKIYNKGEFSITIQFENNKAVELKYEKVKNIKNGLSLTEVEYLLRINSNNKEWRYMRSSNSMPTTGVTLDKSLYCKCTAGYSGDEGQIKIEVYYAGSREKAPY